jgi:hypothetical protein
MKQLIFALVFCMTVGPFALPSHAVVNRLNEKGSLLAYPFIDNVNGFTIIHIANTGDVDTILECYMVTRGIEDNIDGKISFHIYLTPKEKFTWNTKFPFDRAEMTIPGFDGRIGYMFCFAINNDFEGLEIRYNFLTGSATLWFPNSPGTPPPPPDRRRRDQPPSTGGGDHRNTAFNYNAIPHQGLRVVRDRVLNLDGVEYSMATGQIMFEGLVAIPDAISGTLAVASPGIDFPDQIQPEFQIEISCWNEDELDFHRVLAFKDFEQYDLADDLVLDFDNIFTLGFHCATTSPNPLWAVFHQNLRAVDQDLETNFGWGGNVFQEPSAGVSAVIILPTPVP